MIHPVLIIFSHQVLSAILFSPTISAEWTCMGCQTIVTSMATMTSSSEDIKHQTSLLQSQLCPTVPDPAGCTRMLPEFWSAVAPVLWNVYFGEWMCAEGCSQGKSSLVTCSECLHGVKTATTSLAMEGNMSKHWLTKYLGGEGFCAGWSVGTVGECRAIVKILVERALPVFARQNRTSSESFCNEVLGVCSVF